MEGAGSRTQMGTGPGPREKEKKVDGDPEASKVSECLGQVSGWRQMAPIFTVSKCPSSFLC